MAPLRLHAFNVKGCGSSLRRANTKLQLTLLVVNYQQIIGTTIFVLLAVNYKQTDTKLPLVVGITVQRSSTHRFGVGVGSLFTSIVKSYIWALV